MFTYRAGCVAFGHWQQQAEQIGRTGIWNGCGQLALYELHLGRKPALAFSCYVAFCGNITSAGTPPWHSANDVPKQAAVVNVVVVLEIASTAAVFADSLTGGKLFYLLYNDCRLKLLEDRLALR